MLSFLRRAPLVSICIFFISGVILEFVFAFHTFWIEIAFFILIASATWLLLKKISPLTQTVILFIASSLLGINATAHFLQQENRIPKDAVQINFQIEKKLRANQYTCSFESNSFLIELKNCDTLLPGNAITVLGKFKEIDPPKLPWLFNQKKQMLAIGITHQFIPSKIIQSSSNLENHIKFLPQKIQHNLHSKITSAISDTASAAILSALLLGETSLLSKEITSDYSVAGVVHILAVSGMHVALIYELILFILKLILRKKRKWLTFFLAMMLLWGYGAITGFSASVVRACCMFTFFVLSDCFLLSRNTGNTIAGSTLLILYFQPYLIFNLGFLLSLSAVLGIVVIHPIIMRHCYTENKIAYYLISSTSITLSATFTTLPLTLYFFHSFPTYFILANLILVPWSTLLLYFGIAFLLLSGIPIIGSFMTYLVQMTTDSMNQFIHLIHYLPKAQLVEINFNQEQLILAYIIILSATIFIFCKRKIIIHFSGIATLLFIANSYAPPENSAVLFTYYQSNLLLVGNEKEMFLACNNDSLAKKYIAKISSWKCQQNRSSQNIRCVPFPSFFSWNENGHSTAFASFRARNKAPLLLLNEDLKFLKADSSLTEEFQHEKILLGQGVSRKKQELIRSFLSERNIPLQNIQSQPFILK